MLGSPACYTSARVRAGRVIFAAQHAARLVADAAALGLGELERTETRRALEGLATQAFPDGEGIVRLEAHSDAAGRLRLLGSTRELGLDPPQWRAVIAEALHRGPGPAPGAKLCDHAEVEVARQQARRAQVEEALLFDAAGRLVEGSRSCIAVLCEDGSVRVPPLARGGVASIARAEALALVPELTEGDVTREELAGAREVVALNAARGARPVVRLDGRAVGNARPGPLARLLAESLAKAGGL